MLGTFAYKCTYTNVLHAHVNAALICTRRVAVVATKSARVGSFGCHKPGVIIRARSLSATSSKYKAKLIFPGELSAYGDGDSYDVRLSGKY